MKEVEKLIHGYQQFHQDYFIDNPELYKQLFKGQSPKFLVISCCDSRVDPAKILGAEPGDIFVVRNVANLVPNYVDDGKTHGTSAALEFSIKHLKVRHVVVLGHSQCGGIRSLMEGEHQHKTHGFIDPWMSIANPARESVLTNHSHEDLDTQCSLCEQTSIGVSLDNLMTFPFVKERVEKNELFLHGWHFDIETGQLLGKRESDFIPVKELLSE